MGGLTARFSALWRGLFDALVRDNKVLPPVLALLALLMFAWVAAGLFVGGSENEGVSSGRAELVQSRDPNAGADAPEVEDRDTDSYAAYRNKDPFRQLLAPASESTPESSSGDAPEEGTTPTGSASPDAATGSASPDATTGTGGGQETGGGDDRSRKDSDGDGLTNRDEERLGQDPRNPDTDGDGIQDGQDDADADGTPDGQQGGGQGSGGAGAGGSGPAGQQGDGGAGTSGNPGGADGSGGAGSGGGGSGSGDLFDSGGTLPPR